MNQYDISFSKLARYDMDGIYQYLFEQLLTPNAVSKIVDAIEDEINYNLSYMPYYPLVDDDNLASIGVRRMVVKKYLVFFVIDEEKKIVNVIRIIHGAREWKRLLPEQ
jgi:plasmid stabilization system protein ParE